MIVGRGAHVDLSGPPGTPLQMIWKILRYCECFQSLSLERMRIQTIMRFLRDQGANCDWVEPDGSVVNKAEIDALCNMTEGQLEAQYQPIFKYPNRYTWVALTAEERLEAEAERDRSLSKHGFKQPSPCTSQTSWETVDESESIGDLAD